VSIQVTNLDIIDLDTANLGKTVVKWKIINIPGGVAIFANTKISTVGVDINNLNIYNRTILLENQVKHILKEKTNQLLKLLSYPYYKKMFNPLFKE
jgi:hypothetical protein